jgi:hypothetical protein
MPRGIPNIPQMEVGGADEFASYDLASDMERRSLEAQESLTASFMEMHPPPGEKVEKKRHFTYWKMCEDPSCFQHKGRKGWITIDVATGGPFGDQQVATYARAVHGTNLENALGKPGGWPHNSLAQGEVGMIGDSYDPDFPWGTFTNLFLARGGIFMMPIDQFIQCGFHRDPKLAPFRQDEIDQVKLYVCDMCPGGKVEYMEEAHLDQHRIAFHKEHVSATISARETAKVMRDAVGVSGEVERRINQLMQELEELRAQANLKD